jgi:hypothetical protein
VNFNTTFLEERQMSEAEVLAAFEGITLSEFEAALAMLIIGARGRVQREGTGHTIIAECGTLTVTAHQECAGQFPMLLTVDAPKRVFEVEFTDAKDGTVLLHIGGPWQPQLLEAAKPFVRDLGLSHTGQRLS